MPSGCGEDEAPPKSSLKTTPVHSPTPSPLIPPHTPPFKSVQIIDASQAPDPKAQGGGISAIQEQLQNGGYNTTVTHTNRISLADADVLLQEDDEGSVEYKWKLVGISPERLQHLITQMKFRLTEGQGECIYEIGVQDNGIPTGLCEAEFDESIKTLHTMATTLSADVSVVCEKVVAQDPEQGTLKCAEVMVRKYAEDAFVDMRVLICGHVGCGKSTLVGVLTRGGLDNGRGSARQSVFTHLHEVETGRTSSISLQMIGFDSHGNIVNYQGDRYIGGNVSAERIAELSAKVVTIYDLAGHEKYLKTTVTGMTGSAPDYACIMVAADQGLQRMTREHLGLCLGLKIPLFVVVTRVDLATPEQIRDCVHSVEEVLKLPGVRSLPYRIKSEDDVISLAKQLKERRVAPIFCVSCVTGQGVDSIRKFLNLLPIRRDWESLAEAQTEVLLDKCYHQVANVGTVVSGLVQQGVVTDGALLKIGPDEEGEFHEATVDSIQVKRVNVKRVEAGSSASFVLGSPSLVVRAFISTMHKGMVLLHPESQPRSYWAFRASVTVLYAGPAGIQTGFQPVIHCHMSRQKARIVLPESRSVLKIQDQAEEVRFEFLYGPQWLKKGQNFVFMEGKTKGIGTITELLDEKLEAARSRGSSRRSRASSGSRGEPAAKNSGVDVEALSNALTNMSDEPKAVRGRSPGPATSGGRGTPVNANPGGHSELELKLLAELEGFDEEDGDGGDFSIYGD